MAASQAPALEQKRQSASASLGDAFKKHVLYEMLSIMPRPAPRL